MLPEAYLWLMFETLFFYAMITFIICYFFRKHCQDPKLIKEEQKAQEREQKELEESGLVVGLPVREGEIELTAVAAKPLEIGSPKAEEKL